LFLTWNFLSSGQADNVGAANVTSVGLRSYLKRAPQKDKILTTLKTILVGGYNNYRENTMSEEVISSGFQFIHVDYTARSSGKTKKTLKTRFGVEQNATGWTPFDILAEAVRFPGHHPHVPQPLPPSTVFGHEDPLKVLDDIDTWVSVWEKVNGKKYGKNKPVLTNGVISFPDERGNEDWEAFLARSVEWLKEKYGDALRCVVTHLDEPNPHAHYYCVATSGVDLDGKPWANDFASIHQGYAARNQARSAHAKEQGNWKGGGAKTMSAFTKAMRQLQDEFQEKVGKFHGLARKGPGKPRLQHSVAVEQSRARLKLADELVAAEKAERDAKKAKATAQQELLDADQYRRDVEQAAGEKMAAAETAMIEAKLWRRRQQADFDRREKALADEAARVAQVERDAVAAVKQSEAQMCFLNNEIRELKAQMKTLREQLAEVRSDIVKVLKQVGKAAIGPFWHIYDKYVSGNSTAPSPNDKPWWSWLKPPQ
jgi:hypothetical protein